jgi:hypothetical protein
MSALNCTKLLAEEVKEYYYRHLGEQGHYVKTNHHIIQSYP